MAKSMEEEIKLTKASNNNKHNDGEDEECFFDPDLFSNKEVSIVTYTIGNEKLIQDIICSKAATTDHDLTGQIVWPISIFLSW